MLNPGQASTIDVKPFFAGFYGQNGNNVTPSYSINSSSSLFSASMNGSIVSAQAGQTPGVAYIDVTVDDGETQFTQLIGIAVTGTATGISDIRSSEPATTDASVYSLTGQRLAQPRHGLNIRNGKIFIHRK